MRAERSQEAKAGKRILWWVFTPHGAFSQEGPSAKIALNRFQRLHPNWVVAGVFRDDLIIKPPKEPGSPPFVCMFNQGNLQPAPSVEDSVPPPKRQRTAGAQTNGGDK